MGIRGTGERQSRKSRRIWLPVRSDCRYWIRIGDNIERRPQRSSGSPTLDSTGCIVLLEHSNDALQFGQESSDWNRLYLLSRSYHYVSRRISGRRMRTRSLESVCVHCSPYSDRHCGRHGTQISGKKAIAVLNS